MSISEHTEHAGDDEATGRRVTSAFDRWSFDEYRMTAADLGIYRVIYGLSALLLAMPHLDTLEGLPATAWNPPVGPFRLLDGWPPDWMFDGLEIAFSIAVVALLIGYRTRLASFATTGLWFAMLSYTYSTGKISHGLAIFAVAPVFLALAGWGEGLAVDARRRDLSGHRLVVRAWPNALFALTVGLMFVTAAIPKIQAGWLDPRTHAVQRSVLRRVHIDNVGSDVAAWFAEISNPVFWELVDYGTIAIEAGLVLLALRRRWFIAGLCAAVLLHISIWHVLQIGFLHQVIAYGAFIRWDRPVQSLIAPVRALVPSRLPRAVVSDGVLVVVVAVAGLGVFAFAETRLARGLLPVAIWGDVAEWIYWVSCAFVGWHVLAGVRDHVLTRWQRRHLGETAVTVEDSSAF